jgi:hypothetical protein
MRRSLVFYLDVVVSHGHLVWSLQLTVAFTITSFLFQNSLN